MKKYIKIELIKLRNENWELEFYLGKLELKIGNWN